MSRAYYDIAFTPAVRATQSRMGSRATYARMEQSEDRHAALRADEAEFIRERDGFYQASVSESGWPYVQYRGGPAGFLKVLDDKTIGYADFRGNAQYISVGNLQGNDRIALMLMDYANRRRLKIMGRARMIERSADPALIARLEVPGYRARVERAVIITVEGYDWNCPQHITPRFTEAEIDRRASQPPSSVPDSPAGARLPGRETRAPSARHAAPPDGPDGPAAPGVRIRSARS
jgi:predicted pyridoxine 5'-phosphate oxidase superfamily flavin-nucleotide-binding protein